MFSTIALVMIYGFGLDSLGGGVLIVLVILAIMESAFGFCPGCLVFGYLMKLGFIPEEICKRCVDLNG